jgi:hypothetical protein
VSKTRRAASGRARSEAYKRQAPVFFGAVAGSTPPRGRQSSPSCGDPSSALASQQPKDEASSTNRARGFDPDPAAMLARCCPDRGNGADLQGASGPAPTILCGRGFASPASLRGLGSARRREHERQVAGAPTSAVIGCDRGRRPIRCPSCFHALRGRTVVVTECDPELRQPSRVAPFGPTLPKVPTLCQSVRQRQGDVGHRARRSERDCRLPQSTPAAAGSCPPDEGGETP